MPHMRHIYFKASGMAKETMYAYPHSNHALTPWKFIIRCCAKCPSVNLPDKEADDKYSDTSPST